MKYSLLRRFLLTFTLLAFPVFTCLSGCRLFHRADPRELLLPKAGDSGLLEAGVSGWTVSWLSVDGSIGEQTVDACSRFTVSLPRESPVIVVAEPITGSGSFRLQPAGCVLAGGGDTDIPIELTWADGFAADYLLGLARAGISPAAINIERFREAVQRRSSGNPWHLDTRRLSEELAAGDLWIYSFRELVLHEVSPGFISGRWYASYPPDGYYDIDNSPHVLELPAGIHRFFCFPEGTVCTVTVDEAGRFSSILSSGSISGKAPVDGAESLFIQPAVHLREGPAAEESPGGGEG